MIPVFIRLPMSGSEGALGEPDLRISLYDISIYHNVYERVDGARNKLRWVHGIIGTKSGKQFKVAANVEAIDVLIRDATVEAIELTQMIRNGGAR